MAINTNSDTGNETSACVHNKSAFRVHYGYEPINRIDAQLMDAHQRGERTPDIRQVRAMNKNELMKEKKFFRKKIVKNPNTRLQDGSDRRIEPFNGINIGRLHMRIKFLPICRI